jgi:hypothetical protein
VFATGAGLPLHLYGTNLSLSWGNVAIGELILVLIERSLNPLPHEMGHLRSGLIKCGLNVTVMIYGTIKPTPLGNLRYKNIWVMVDPKRQSIKEQNRQFKLPG